MEQQDKKREEDAVTLGLSTGQALAKLRDQLSGLLEQHQRPERRRASAQEQCVNSFLYHGNRHSCLHWPGAALTLLVVLGLLCCHGSQPRGRWVVLFRLNRPVLEHLSPRLRSCLFNATFAIRIEPRRINCLFDLRCDQPDRMARGAIKRRSPSGVSLQSRAKGGEEENQTAV